MRSTRGYELRRGGRITKLQLDSQAKSVREEKRTAGGHTSPTYSTAMFMRCPASNGVWARRHGP